MAKAWQRMDRAQARLSRDAVAAMQDLPWFTALTADQRSWVGLVVQAGLAAFTDWLRDPSRPPRPDTGIFGAAPPELTRAVSLKQTVALVRVTVDVLEAAVPRIAPAGEEQALREAVLRYSREVAFAAAEVYAVQAEVRGAWDARLEAGVVDALVKGTVTDLVASRAATLGWGRPAWVLALAARTPDEAAVADLHHLARRTSLSLLAGEVAAGLLLVVGGTGEPGRAVRPLVDALPDGPVVVGPVVDDLAAAGGSAAEALAGLAVVAGWSEAPRPVPSGALLVERAVLGDETARTRLLEEVHKPLLAAGGDLLRTVEAFLECGSSVEATGRLLFLHPNTVRYRLKKVSELLGLDLSQSRDTSVARTALLLGRVRPVVGN